MAEKTAKRPVLAPVDFSLPSEAALLKACELAECLGLPVVVLHVVHDPGEMPGYYAKMAKKKNLGRMQDAAREMFNEFMHDVLKRHPGVKSLKRAERMLVIGLPPTRILQVADKLDAVMVVMGSKGETGIKHMMLGSVAQRVVQLCPVPVTVVKADSQTEE
ncbi:MAG: universal stress protein [Candidatus Thiodiazotropha sp. (ex Dulcina madagascariensis)]|nr:universal stress protein [Candidatus Thiodiazotropha sp. (ex Epidulcina cf. delphinae)]MCU7936241.1 universal stress protein [Candidatus Thiodiazotropha sp. (ex Dulcina madagascariensis)]